MFRNETGINFPDKIIGYWVKEMKSWAIKEKAGVKFFRINPAPNLNLVFLTRIGGVSKDNYQSLNLSYDVGDNPNNVDMNYKRVKKTIGIDKIFT